MSPKPTQHSLENQELESRSERFAGFSSFTLSATVNNVLVVSNPASFSAAKGSISGGQTGCSVPHLRVLNGSLHS